MSLSDLKTGETGIICGYQSRSLLANRLRELGLVRGARVTVKRASPFGDPIEITIRDYSLSLRKKDAGEILVEKI